MVKIEVILACLIFHIEFRAEKLASFGISSRKLGAFGISVLRLCAKLCHLRQHFLLNSSQHPEMAPHLAKSQVALITGMLSSELFTNSEIAIAANCSTHCSTRGERRIHSNVRYYGAPQAPRNSGGRKRSITPVMLDALCEHLLEKPGLYQSEMILFLLDEFDVLVTASSIGRALRSRSWTKKQIRCIVNELNADLHNHYLYQISSLFPSTLSS